MQIPLLERRKTRPTRSLTAAASRVKADENTKLRRLVQPWQHRSMGFYETLGEINFAGQFYARTISKVRYFAAELDDNGDPQESENAELRDLWARIQDPGGGRTNLLTAYGQLMFLCGECYLVCTGDSEAPEGETWEILSVAELRATDNGRYQRITAPGLGFQELVSAPDDEFQPIDGEIAVYRLYRPDPRFRKLADAPMRGVLTLCEELILLDLAVRARARSRAAGPGILLISDALTLPSPDGGEQDRNLLADPVFGPMIESIMSPLSDPGSAAAVVPHIMTVPAEIDIEKVMRLIKLNDPAEQYQEQQTRTETVKRIGTGLDFPIEYLTGISGTNHWNGWLIDESSWQEHIMPVVQRLCDDFASAYLRPAAKAAGVANWQRVTIGYDAAEVINHPDKAKDAFQAYDRRAVGKMYLRAAIGAEEINAMPEDELNEALGVATRDASLAVYGIPSIKAGGIEPEPGVVENPSGTQSEPTGPSTGADVEKGPPPDGQPEPRTASLTAVPFDTARILGIAEAQLERAREVAGNRIRNRSKGCADCQERLEGQPWSLTAAILGVEQARALLGDVTERDLVAGTAASFTRSAARVGIDPVWAAELGDLVEAHAARTLYEAEPPQMPAAFAALAARALTQPAVAAA